MYDKVKPHIKGKRYDCLVFSSRKIVHFRKQSKLEFLPKKKCKVESRQIQNIICNINYKVNRREGKIIGLLIFKGTNVKNIFLKDMKTSTLRIFIHKGNPGQSYQTDGILGKIIALCKTDNGILSRRMNTNQKPWYRYEQGNYRGL